MAIDTDTRQQLEYFTGIEVENTIMKGELTLFVVGVKPVDEILSVLENTNKNQNTKIRHIYLGTSQSFIPKSYDDWQSWNTMISGLLDAGVWVTLDFDSGYAEEIHEEGWDENNRFIAMISLKLPYIRLFNYHTTLKIDDRTWGSTNSGVWCHRLHDLMQDRVYTDWKDYVGDTPVNKD